MITKNHKKVLLFGLLLLFFVVGSGSALAAEDIYRPLAPLPHTVNEGCGTSQPYYIGEQYIGGGDCQTTFSKYLTGLFKLAIGAAGVLAVFFLVLGGIEYASTDAVGGKSDGIAKMKNAIWGLLLALISWLILYTINPDLLSFKALNLKTQTPNAQPAKPQ